MSTLFRHTMYILANESYSQAMGLEVGHRCFNSPLLQRSITPVFRCLINRRQQVSIGPEIGRYPVFTNIDRWNSGWRDLRGTKRLLPRRPPRSRPKAPPSLCYRQERNEKAISCSLKNGPLAFSSEIKLEPSLHDVGVPIIN